MTDELDVIHEAVVDMIDNEIKKKYEGLSSRYMLNVVYMPEIDDSESIPLRPIEVASKIIDESGSAYRNLALVDFVGAVIITRSELFYAEMKNRLDFKKYHKTCRYDNGDFIGKMKAMVDGRLRKFSDAYGKANLSENDSFGFG